MNIVNDVLFLRKPKLDYVCPPICEFIFTSGSSQSAIVLPSISKNPAPGCPTANGLWQTWDLYPKAICYNVYAGVADSFELLGECLQAGPNGLVAVCSPGWYKLTQVVNGNETAVGVPLYCSGFSYLAFPLPLGVGGCSAQDVDFNLYRNTNIAEPTNGTLYQTFLMEVGPGINVVGCGGALLRISAITMNGETPLSCASGPTAEVPCSDIACDTGFVWDPAVCLCVPCENFNPTCPQGAIWDYLLCHCITGGKGGCGPQDCPVGKVWDGLLCECVTPGYGPIDIIGPEVIFCVGQAYDGNFTAVDGTLPLAWTVTSGAIPPGLALGTPVDYDIPLSGTPTAAGTYSFTLRATDANGAFFDKVFSIAGLDITTPEVLPTAQEGGTYSTTLALDGGTSPVWSPVSSFPCWLAIDPSTGTLSGNPPYGGLTEFITVGVTALTALGSVFCEKTFQLELGCINGSSGLNPSCAEVGSFCDQFDCRGLGSTGYMRIANYTADMWDSCGGNCNAVVTPSDPTTWNIWDGTLNAQGCSPSGPSVYYSEPGYTFSLSESCSQVLAITQLDCVDFGTPQWIFQLVCRPPGGVGPDNVLWSGRKFDGVGAEGVYVQGGGSFTTPNCIVLECNQPTGTEYEDSLYAYYKLDDADATAGLVDSLGAHNLQYVSGSGASEPGKIGTAFPIDTLSWKYPSSPDFSFSGSFTVRFWIYIQNLQTGNDQPILSAGNWRIVYGSDGKIDFQIDGSPSNFSNKSLVVPTSAWTRVVCAFNGRSWKTICFTGGPTSSFSETSMFPNKRPCAVPADFVVGPMPNVAIDELGFWKDYYWTPADANTDWNGGAGVTYPLP